MKAPDAKFYDTLLGGEESSDNPKPVSKDAIRARKNAIREGRLTVTQAEPAPEPVAAPPEPTICAEAEVETGSEPLYEG